MKLSRAPAWNVLGDTRSKVWLEIVDGSSDGRLLLPVSLRRRVTWAVPNETLPLLAAVRPDGSAILEPLSACEEYLATLNGVLDRADEAERTLLTFAAMASHTRVALQPDGRLRLSPLLADHLDASQAQVWVGACRDQVWLWSRSAWKSQMDGAHLALAEALEAASSTS